MTEDEARAELGVAAGVGVEASRQAYRRRAAATHPDAGGTADAFARVTEAWAVVRAAEERLAEERAKCRACRGEGRRVVASGWRRLRVPCEACDGTGRRA